MSSSYERLAALFSEIGLSTERGSYAEAEISAYAAGIELVRQCLSQMKEQIFFTLSGTEPSLQLYADMLSIAYNGKDRERLLSVIRTRLSHSFGAAEEKTAYEKERRVIGGGWLKNNHDTYTAEGIMAEDLPNLGKWLAGAAPPDKPIYLPYGGMTFEQWDALGGSFRFYNRLCLPFSCIDTLSSAYFH